MDAILDAGFYLLECLQEGTVFERDVMSLFVTLVHLERAADAYRTFVNPDAKTEYPAEYESVIRKLDEFREAIHGLRAELPDSEIEQAMRTAGNDFGLRFTSA